LKRIPRVYIPDVTFPLVIEGASDAPAPITKPAQMKYVARIVAFPEDVLHDIYIRISAMTIIEVN
jgi:hypothetical protein